LISPLCDQSDGAGGVSGDVSASGGDVGGAGEAVQTDREVAQGGHDAGSVAGADLGVVFGEGDVADPVQAVLCDTRSRVVSEYADWRPVMPGA